MTKYSPTIEDVFGEDIACMEEDPEGAYVKYSDVEGLIEALKAYANAIKDQTVSVSIPYDDLDSDDFDIIEEFESGEPDNFGSKAEQALKKAGVE